VSRPPRTFRSAKDIDEERLVNALRRSASAGSVRPRTGVVLLGAGRCWCWRCRAARSRSTGTTRGAGPRRSS
jgi:hypothetical protein